MTDWDESVDLLDRGQRRWRMVAALAAVDAGLQPLVIEEAGVCSAAPRDCPAA